MTIRPTLFPVNISNTDLNLWSQCELRWFRSRCQHLKKPTFNIDLSAGGAFASAIELARNSFYKDKLSEKESVELAFNFIIKTLHECEFQDELKSPERMGLAVMKYFENYPLENAELMPVFKDNLPMVEHTFEIHLDIKHPETKKPLVFKGVLDMLGETMGRKFVVDEKTCKVISTREADLQATAGQYIGYAWAAKKLGIDVQGAIIRKVAIQKSGIKFKEYEIPISDYMIEMWELAMLQKVHLMVSNYEMTLKSPEAFKAIFMPDFQLGCTAYFQPCQFNQGCSSKFGENFIDTEFIQEYKTKDMKEGVSIKQARADLGVVN